MDTESTMCPSGKTWIRGLFLEGVHNLEPNDFRAVLFTYC